MGSLILIDARQRSYLAFVALVSWYVLGMYNSDKLRYHIIVVCGSLILIDARQRSYLAFIVLV